MPFASVECYSGTLVCYTLDNTKSVIVVRRPVVGIRIEQTSVRTIVRIAAPDNPRVVRVDRVRILAEPRLIPVGHRRGGGVTVRDKP